MAANSVSSMLARRGPRQAGPSRRTRPVVRGGQTPLGIRQRSRPARTHQRLMHRHASLEVAHHLFNTRVPLMAGTDTFGYPSMAPGISLQKELELLHEGGLAAVRCVEVCYPQPLGLFRKGRGIRPGRRGSKSRLAPGQWESTERFECSEESGGCNCPRTVAECVGAPENAETPT
jgi:hypothetical protein